MNLQKKLTDSDLEEIVDVWNRKGNGLLCKLSFRLLSHYICILSLLMHFVKHLSTLMSFNNTISKGGWVGGGGGGGRKVPWGPPK